MGSGAKGGGCCCGFHTSTYSTIHAADNTCNRLCSLYIKKDKHQMVLWMGNFFTLQKRDEVEHWQQN